MEGYILPADARYEGANRVFDAVADEYARRAHLRTLDLPQERGCSHPPSLLEKAINYLLRR